RRAAAEFGNDLYNRPDANQVTNLAFLAELKKLELKVTKPFDNRTNGLEEFEDVALPSSRSTDAPRESLRDVVREKAFNLTDTQPILLSPIVGPHAVYVIARQGKLPSEVQPLEKIVDKVTADYRGFMAMDLARKAGMAFHTNLTNGLSLGKSFDE